VHDYHFLTLAVELRKLGVAQEIGFFLHTPWPRPHIFASLDQARDLAEAMLAYDLIGFQTDSDRKNFAEFVAKELRVPNSGATVRTRAGSCRLATFPIGIAVQDFAEQAQRASHDADVQRLRASLNGSQLLIGVDRIDYSKGLGERLRAYDRLLDRYPRLKRRMSVLQIAVPSRSNIDTYRHLQHQIAALAGEVNAKHGDVDWTPIRYITKSFCQSKLAGFYRASKVGVVTPLRDGMNLVAKEYVAAQDPVDPGVLVLSRSAGAACELNAALQVDPNDTETMAQRIAMALMMPLAERTARWQDMMDVLLRHSLHAWFSDFMTNLKATRRTDVKPSLLPVPVLEHVEPGLAAAQH
jgi:trehalose 6-phosphate synthase